MSDVVVVDGVEYPLVTVRCCREWQVAVGIPVKRCGLCGEKPQYDGCKQ